MSGFNGKLIKLSANYKTLSVILLNTVVLFAILNLIADGIHDIQEGLRKRAAAKGAKAFGYREYQPALAPLYPGLTPEQITSLTMENRKMEFMYDPFTQFREKPASGKYVNVSKAGFRLIKNQGPWPIDKKFFNVFVFGGSTTFGYRLSDDQTIASHLQDIMGSRTGLPVKVYNFGRCSYFLSQERILLEKLIISGAKPDCAIFIDGLNEFACWDGRPSYSKELTKFMAGDYECSIGGLVMQLPIIKLLGLESDDDMPEDPLLNENENRKIFGANKRIVETVTKRYTANKRIAENMCRGFDIIAVFVWQPVAVHHYDLKNHIFNGFDYNKLTPYLTVGFNGMAETIKARQMGKNFIYAADIQKDLKKPLYVDAYHYSGEMCRILADFIFTKIQERNLIPVDDIMIKASHGAAQ